MSFLFPPTARRLPIWMGLLALLTTTLAACSDDPASPESEADSISEFIALSDDLTQLNEAADAVGLDDLLRTRTDLTIFAPTNLGFEGLGPDLLTRLSDGDNQDVLDKILRRHVVPRLLLASDLQDGATLETLEGTPLNVTVDEEGEIAVEGIPITRTDAFVNNGVLHQIEGLARDHLTLAERLRVTPLLTIFANALERAELESLVNEGAPYTLFIPLNGAFENLGDEPLEVLLRPSNRDVLQRTLLHHIIPGQVRIEDLQDGDTFVTLDGSSRTVTKGNGLTFVDDARVIIPDVATSDGTIHFLDRVVLDHLTLTERFRITPSLFTSFTLFRDAGIFDALTDEGTFTLFAPSTRSLDALGDEFRIQLRQRTDLLERTMQFHAAPVSADPERLRTGEDIPGFGGFTLPVRATGDDVFIGSRGLVQFPPIKTSNGFIYTVNALNPPPDINLEESAVFLRLFQFINAMRSNDLLNILQSEDPYTVFAPTDRVFELLPIPGDNPVETLRYHIVPGRYAFEDLGPRQYLETLLTDSLMLVEILEGQLTADSIGVLSRDGFAVNGVIHQLATFLDPCAFWERPEPGEPCIVP